jgi:hypothetical protein
MAGYEGLFHWLGTGWAPVPFLPGQRVAFVAAVSATEIWAHDDNHLYRGNGTTFTEVTWPRANPRFQGVFAFGPGNVWVIEQAALWHWDGQTFTIEPGFDVVSGPYNYARLFVTTPGDVWMLRGEAIHHRTALGKWEALPVDSDDRQRPLVGVGLPDGQVWLAGRWGRSWRLDKDHFALTVPLVPANTISNLTGIWSDGKGTTIAVGDGAPLRNTAGGWEPMARKPYVGRMNAVWGRSATDVWAVGNMAAVYHYDGTTWSLMDTGIPVMAASYMDLYAMGGTETGEVWAIGRSGQFVRFDGQVWTWGVSASLSDMLALWVRSPDDVWACGRNGSIQRWKRGAGWAQFDVRPEFQVDYRTIWGRSETDVWIVYGTSAAYHFDGKAWKLVPKPAGYTGGRDIYALAGSPDGTWWGVGEFGMVLRWDGTALQLAYAHAVPDLRAVWAGADGQAWTAGSAGQIFYHP